MRTYGPSATATTRGLLEVLADPGSSTTSYREAMVLLGGELADDLLREHPSLGQSTLCVACTVEDADFLARGLVERLEEVGLDSRNMKLVCFWNERVRNFEGDGRKSFDVAPVVKQYREAADLRNAVIVVVKSIISGACVVKTNLAMLIDDVLPSHVFVAAPVMLSGAEKRLESEFSADLVNRFRYLTFATDDQKDKDDNVLPGIGGSVYERLGFHDKTSYVPEIVKSRRRRLAHA